MEKKPLPEEWQLLPDQHGTYTLGRREVSATLVALGADSAWVYESVAEKVTKEQAAKMIQNLIRETIYMEGKKDE